MLIARIQNFVVRRFGVLVKKGFIKKDQMMLFYPKSQLYFGNWLPSAAYKDVFIKCHYDCPVELKDGARIVDGGANIGLSSLYFLNRYPGAYVEAYEANPTTCRLLSKTLASAKFAANRYTIHEKALHTENSRIPFYVVPNVPSALNSSVEGRDNLLNLGEKIEVDALDFRSLLYKPIDLLKLDIEGHEYKILDLPEIIPSAVRAMVIEFHDMENHQDACKRIFHRFRDVGYKFEIVERPELDLAMPSAWEGSHMVRIYSD